MGTREIIKAIQELPTNEQILIIEQTLKTIRETESQKKMKQAVNSMMNDYLNDEELISFTQLDCETFYETR